MLTIEMFTEQDIVRYYKFLPNRPANDCWLWAGTIVTAGYGYFAVIDRRTRKRHQLGAHRFAALIKYGQIPDNVFAMHTCDNPRCCNPEHIELGSPSKNTQDAVDRGLLKPCKGEKHGRSKLTEDQVRYILSCKGKVSVMQLSRELGVHKNTIYDIHRGNKWKHISSA